MNATTSFPRATLLAMLLAGTVAATPAQAWQAVAPVAGAWDARLKVFLDAEFETELKMSPQMATELGSKLGQERLDDISDAAAARELAWRRDSVARLKAQFDRAKLSPEAQVNYDIWVMELERAELRDRLRRYEPPFYSTLGSLHSELPDFLINTHVVDTAADMRAWTARVRAIPAVLDEAIAQSRRSSAAGIRAPRFAVEKVIAGSHKLIDGAPFGAGADTPLWADAKVRVAALQRAGKVTPAQAQRLLTEARTAIESLAPVYGRVIAWAQGEMPAAPSGRVGASTLPGGAAFYAARLKLSTTTDLSAEDIHRIGRTEVARIEGEMDALARSAGFPDRAAFRAERRRLMPAVPWNDTLRADYLARSNAAVTKVRAMMPKWFGTLPAYRMEVVREPSFSEVPGGAAHASPPSPDGSRPGRVYVHQTGTIADFDRITDLMCHEAAPGHVAQLDIQVREANGPKFRRGYFYGAFVEGWGLYAEALCKEMGAFDNAAEDMARLNAELFRAVRLVVDTGLHAQNWSEDEAVDYMIAHGSDPEAARAEARRYITNPGQATSYKIGMLKIVELRRRAEAALGPRSDIKGFHDLLIASGSQPLAILERRVDAWIAARSAA